MNDAVPLSPAAQPKPGILDAFPSPPGTFWESTLVGLLAAFGGILQLRISRSYSNSLLTAALIYSCLNAVGFSERVRVNSSRVGRQAIGAVLLLLSLALSFIAFHSAPGTGRPFYSFADMEN